MAISQDLFLAILAMDSYNRGYGAGLGDAQNGLGGVGSQIGNATVTRQANSPDNQAASFYAQSYTWNGQTVIAYRGTDAFGGDLKNGYPTAWGMQSNQAMLAVDFYKAVLNGADPQTANVTFTGHSLGGGLAGYVAALYGRSATIFDQMPFTAAVENAYSGRPGPWSTRYQALVTSQTQLSRTGYTERLSLGL